MRNMFRVVLTLLIALAALLLVNCSGSPGCNGVTFGSATCTSTGGSGFGSGGSGGGGGGGGGGGSKGVNASQAAALVYYGNTAVDAAGVTSSGTFGTLNSYTAPTLASNVADGMIIVSKQFLYVPMGDTTVTGYSIDRSTGALTLIPGSPFSITGGTTDDLATDPKGKFLFVGSEGSANISVFTINSSSGALSLVSGSPFTSAGLIDSDILAVDASGKFLYAGQITPSNGVAGFSIDQTTGALAPLNSGAVFPLNVAQIHASPTVEFLLGVQEVQDGTTGATDSHIFVFSINVNTGVPTAVGSGTLTLNPPFDFAISPNGNFVYALEATAGSTVAPIEGFSMNASTGALASIGTFSGVPTAEDCQFDQTGAFLFCANALNAGTTLTVNGANPSTGVLTHGVDLTVSLPFPLAVTD